MNGRDLNSKWLNPALRLSHLGIAVMFVPILLIFSLALAQGQTPSAAASGPCDYECRKAQLLTLVQQDFADDPLRDVESALDKEPYDQIMLLDCPKPIDNPNGWSVKMRTGGRPFLDYYDITLNGAPWTLVRCTKGTSNIPQEEIDAHYATCKDNFCKTVNRMEFTHRASNGYPIVLVMTPDGFFNVAGANEPKLLGAATRFGFVEEPFVSDYKQHVDQVSISVLDDNRLLILFNIHSEAGEGVLQFELDWDAVNEQPELHFTSAYATRLAQTTRLGFAGFDFMKGPTLSGLLSQGGTPEGGIQAFHDGRTLFLVHADGATTRNLLISPVLTTTVVSEDIAMDVTPGTKLILDQPQNVVNYFSKFPDPPYDKRTDLIMQLTASTVSPVTLRRAQVAVDLTAQNPEANETVNTFYATDMAKGQVYEFSYVLSVAAQHFEKLHWAHQQGVVFISNRSESSSRLYFLPLDNNLVPIGTPTPLTDGVISDPHHPSASADGQSIIFDADDYGVSTRQRVYTLSLRSGAVRRLTVDPFGQSSDATASFNGDGTQFAMITNRNGTPTQLITATVASGLGSGYGIKFADATDADWCHTRNEFVYVNASGLYTQTVGTSNGNRIIPEWNLSGLRYSPSCNQIAYVDRTKSELLVFNQTNNNNQRLLSNAENPAWVDEDHLIVQETVGDNTDLYLYTISTEELTPLTNDPAVDGEPTYVGAVGPTVNFDPLPNPPPDCGPVTLSGFVDSVGVPNVQVNGLPATVAGDQWSIVLNLSAGPQTITAAVTDSATGLTDTEQEIVWCTIRIENDSTGIRYNGWRGVMDANASGGSYRVSKVMSGTVQFKFTGTTISWVTYKGPDQGKAQVTIDGVDQGTFNLYSTTPKWNIQRVFSGLANQSHTLLVRVLGIKKAKSSDTNVSVDAFVVGSTTTQDTDPGVKFDSWKGVTDSNASDGSYRKSGKQKATISLTFTGTSVNWITALGPGYGQAKVKIDGQLMETADLYAASQQWQVVKTYEGLSAGTHTLKLKVLGTKDPKSSGTKVVVDAFSGPITVP
jgi:hypothetical protein